MGETRELQEELQRIGAAKASTEELRSVREKEFEKLRNSAAEHAAAEHEHAEQQLQSESLTKEIGRSQHEIQILDEKIQQLRAESDDIRQRASFVLQTMPDAMDVSEPQGS